MNREDVYRIVDALYRIHENEFHTQHILRQSIAAQYARSRLLTNGAMGATVAGAIAVLPIMVSLGQITWTSAPAAVIYALVAALGGLWGYQINSARNTFRTMGVAETSATPPAVIRWPEYIYERIATCGTRIRLLDELADELRKPLPELSQAEQSLIESKLDRNAIARRFCLSEIRNVQSEAERLKQEGLISDVEYEGVLQWAAPFTEDFATLDDQPGR